MTRRNTVKRLATRGALLCATVAALCAVPVGTASAQGNFICRWENAYANPRLWIRAYPSTDAQTIYSITYGGDFYGTPYAAYNDGTHWVQLSAGGWANAKSLAWAGRAREQVSV